MSWGTELWDEWDRVTSHTQKGLGFLENYSQFVKDRCQVEMEYAKALKKLVKNYTPKKKDDDEHVFTYARSFHNVIKETSDLAGQHEVIAENLTSYIVAEINLLVKDLKEEKKKHLNEGAKQQSSLNNSINQLEKSKKNYEKAFREAEKAHEAFTKADADLNLSRADVKKQEMNSNFRNQQCEDCKNEYANQLQKTNNFQEEHYTTAMPNIFQSLQDLDQRRIRCFKDLLKKSVDIERAVYPIIDKCLDGIVEAANSIDEKHDSLVVIEKYKSGFTPPGDIQFDDLSTPRQNGDPVPVTHTPERNLTIKGTISAAKFKKRGGLLGIFGSNKNNSSFSEKDDYRDLPPNQRKKKLQQKINEVDSKLKQESAARDALLKMKGVYEDNASLGNPMSVTGQLKDTCAQIDKLKSELDHFQQMLDDVENEGHNTSIASSGTPSTPNPSSLGRHTSSVAVIAQNGGGHSSPRSSLASHRTSLSEESLSRSASDSSVCTNPISSPPTIPTNVTSPSSAPTTENSQTSAGQGLTTITSSPKCSPPATTQSPPTQGSSHSPESGIGLSRNSLHGSDSYEQQYGEDNDNNEEFFDVEPLPIIGQCTAIYVFEGTSEGSMSMSTGETLDVIELDQGDGWTRVRRKDGPTEEGFVPTSYIDIKLQNNC